MAFFLIFIVAFLGYFGYRRLKIEAAKEQDEVKEIIEKENKI